MLAGCALFAFTIYIVDNFRWMQISVFFVGDPFQTKITSSNLNANMFLYSRPSYNLNLKTLKFYSER